MRGPQRGQLSPSSNHRSHLRNTCTYEAPSAKAAAQANLEVESSGRASSSSNNEGRRELGS